MKLRNYIKLSSVLSLTLLASCQSTKVEEVDAGANIQLTTEFGATALNQTVKKMVDSILVFPPVVEMTKNKRPVLVVYPLRNKTSQHINTDQILASTRTQLIRSGKFVFVNRESDDALIKEVKHQQNSGLVNKDSAKQFGKQVAPEYALTGTVTEIVSKKDDVKDVYYNVSMELKNLESGVLEWADEKPIRLKSTKSRFGL